MNSHEARLIDDLLGRASSAGQQMARPVRNVNDRVLVNYGLSLVQILDMDEINQNILLNVWETQVRDSPQRMGDTGERFLLTFGRHR